MLPSWCAISPKYKIIHSFANIRNLGAPPSLLGAVSPHVQAPAIMSPSWDLPFIPITPAHALISSSWSLQLACLPIPVPSFSSFLPKVAEVIYIKHTSGHISLLLTNFLWLPLTLENSIKRHWMFFTDWPQCTLCAPWTSAATLHKVWVPAKWKVLLRLIKVLSFPDSLLNALPEIPLILSLQTYIPVLL